MPYQHCSARRPGRVGIPPAQGSFPKAHALACYNKGVAAKTDGASWGVQLREPRPLSCESRRGAACEAVGHKRLKPSGLSSDSRGGGARGRLAKPAVHTRQRQSNLNFLQRAPFLDLRELNVCDDIAHASIGYGFFGAQWHCRADPTRVERKSARAWLREPASR